MGLVTGATSGLGLAVAKPAGAGAHLVLHDLSIQRDERASGTRRRGGDVAADLSQRASIESMMAGLLDRLKAIDVW